MPRQQILFLYDEYNDAENMFVCNLELHCSVTSSPGMGCWTRTVSVDTSGDIGKPSSERAFVNLWLLTEKMIDVKTPLILKQRVNSVSY